MDRERVSPVVVTVVLASLAGDSSGVDGWNSLLGAATLFRCGGTRPLGPL